MKKSETIPSKLSTWITMLLVWNIVLISIAIYYLLARTAPPLTVQEISNACTQTLLLPTSSRL